MKRHAISLDFDHCYGKKRPEKLAEFMDHNDLLIQTLIQDPLEDYHGHTIFIGSHRQCLSLDAKNGIINGQGSCYRPIFLLSQHLHATFDDLLLYDIYAKKEPGYTIKKLFATMKELGYEDTLFSFKEFTALLTHPDLADLQEISSSLFSDEGKINILYAQMHKMSLEHPDDEIVFEFIDDQEYILNTIDVFFRAHPSLMPHNITLRLTQYDQKTLRPINPNRINDDGTLASDYGIKGTGQIDEDYYQTIVTMGKIAQEKEKSGARPHRGVFQMSKYITPELLQWHQTEKTPTEALALAISKVPPSFFQAASPHLDAAEAADQSLERTSSPSST